MIKFLPLRNAPWFTDKSKITMHAHYIQQALVKVEQKLENERTRNQVGILESIFTFFLRTDEDK